MNPPAIPQKLPKGDRDVLAPHQPLTDYYADENARSAFLRNLFDRTAVDYDRVERLLAFGSGPWYRGQALKRAGLTAGMRVVDVGVGTGLTANEAARLTGDASCVTGIDPSPGMLANARIEPGIRLLEGRAEALPLDDNSADFLSMGYALRHVSDLEVAFGEFHRVLRPGGRICLLEITPPTSGMSRYALRLYMRHIIPVLVRLSGSSKDTALLWRYYWDSIDACVTPARVLAALRAAGFADARRHIDRPILSMLSEYQGTKS